MFFSYADGRGFSGAEDGDDSGGAVRGDFCAVCDAIGVFLAYSGFGAFVLGVFSGVFDDCDAYFGFFAADSGLPRGVDDGFVSVSAFDFGFDACISDACFGGACVFS